MADCSAESLLEYNEIVMKMFSSEEDGFQFYNEYAFNKGFSVRKGSVEWNTANTEIIKRKFYCSAQGFREEKHLNKEKRKRQPRPLSHDGCLAKLVIAVDKMTRKWYVKDFIDEHNHPLCPRDLSCLLRSHRRIANRLNVSTALFHIGGKDIAITLEDVQHIMGLPNLGIDVDITTCTTYLVNDYASTNKIMLTTLEQSITSSTVPDDKFIRSFVLFTIGIILAPTRNEYVDSKHLTLVDRVSSIPNYNWAQFTLNHLLRSIRQYKQ